VTKYQASWFGTHCLTFIQQGASLSASQNSSHSDLSLLVISVKCQDGV